MYNKKLENILRLIFVPPFLLLICTLALCRSAAAQDSHYWSEQYGTRSELLGGAVVGSPQDLSTTFYNPGGLMRLETESFLLSAHAFEYQGLRIKESTGRFHDLTTDKVVVGPSLVAGTFPRSWVPGTLAYSVLTRQRSEFRIYNWADGTVPGWTAESAATNIFIDTRAVETWGGLTWAGDTGDFGIGATLYGARRSQRSRFEFLFQPVPTGTPGITVSTVDDYSYWHFRLLAKTGVYWRRRDLVSFGITFTSPGLPLFGNGNAAYYRSVVPVDSSGVATITDALAPNDLSVQYRSPMSVALGARYGASGKAIYATVEWFNSVDRYQVLETSSLPGSGPGSTLRAALTQELATVVNFAVGFEYSPRERLTFFGSFLTNMTSAVEDPKVAHSVTTWDMFQITSGIAFATAKVDFTLGGSYSAGNDQLEWRSDLPGPPITETLDVRYQRIKVFIGFEFGS